MKKMLRKKSRIKKIVQNGEMGLYDLHPKHPHYIKKVFRARKGPVIVDIIGPRLPDSNNATEEDHGRYAKLALLLFKPYRHKKDLLEGHCSFLSACQEYQKTFAYLQSQASTILAKFQQHYIGKRMAIDMLRNQAQESQQTHEHYKEDWRDDEEEEEKEECIEEEADDIEAPQENDIDASSRLNAEEEQNIINQQCKK